MRKYIKIFFAVLAIMIVLGILQFLIPVPVIPAKAEIETIAVFGGEFSDNLTAEESSQIEQYLRELKMCRKLHFGAQYSGKFVISVIYRTSTGSYSLSVNALEQQSDIIKKGTFTKNYIIHGSDLYDYLAHFK